MTAPLSDTFFLSMIYTGFKRVGRWWNYRNVISPFYRLYYIENGHGRVYINNRAFDLTPGTLFLIPKFTFHSYECEDFMDHYYVCFFDDLKGNVGISNTEELQLKVNARPCDPDLIKRYLEINPDRHLLVSDPQKYDNDRSIYSSGDDRTAARTDHYMESQGILLQLFSRFITEASTKRTASGASSEKLDSVVQYVNRNLDKRITLSELSNLVFLTPDYFSKFFKKVMGLTPCEYIQMKRIERAQALLITSNRSIMQIAEGVGICNPSQFTRLFTKIARCSPTEYRAKQRNI